MMSKHSLTIPDFARLLGHPEQKLPPACRDTIAQGNWDYDWIEGDALDDLVTGLLDRIRRKEFSISVPGDKTRWVKGWVKTSRSSSPARAIENSLRRMRSSNPMTRSSSASPSIQS